MMSQIKATIVLAGNPNCGKTALFNALTGSRQHVGNWPGVTVEQKSGILLQAGSEISVVDLPGIYSLNVHSDERAVDERIAGNYLLSNQAQLIINVVDASNLVRNLYLSLQLLEMRQPLILAVNMMDILDAQGIKLDLMALSKALGCPVVPLAVTCGKGIKELKHAISACLKEPKVSSWQMIWPSAIQEALDPLVAQLVTKHSQAAASLALRLLENDRFAAQQVDQTTVELAQQEMSAIEQNEGEEPDIIIADTRYIFSSDLIATVTTQVATKRRSISKGLDKIVLNRVLGIPIFFAVMYLMFLFAINVGGAFQDFFDISSDALFVQSFANLMQSWHWPDWIVALLANGLGRGINTTITFIPVIGALFLFLSFLEDSGYMARAAFVMDRLMQAVGLPGKAFVPMIVGFGCNVPAVMAARTLSNRRDRILTVMMMPFMSCGARLAIFAVFASAFFQQGGQNIIFILYITGILVAVLTGFLLRKTLLKGEPAALVMELPPYHWPSLNSILRHAWHRLKSFVFRAGQFIVPICMLIGILNSIGIDGKFVDDNATQVSLLAKSGQVLTPIFKPMGITSNNWPATVSLVTGVLAKEVVVGTLNTLYSQAGHMGEKLEQDFSLPESLKEAFNSIAVNLASLGEALDNPFVASEAPHDMNNQVYGYMVHQFGGGAAAFAYLLFILLYFPCVSTVAAMRREIGNAWAWFSMAWSTGLAYTLSVFCYQALTFNEHPQASVWWLSGISLIWLFVIIILRQFASATSGEPHALRN